MLISLTKSINIKLYFHKYKNKTKTFTHTMLKQSVEEQSKGQIGQILIQVFNEQTNLIGNR